MTFIHFFTDNRFHRSGSFFILSVGITAMIFGCRKSSDHTFPEKSICSFSVDGNNYVYADSIVSGILDIHYTNTATAGCLEVEHHGGSSGEPGFYATFGGYAKETTGDYNLFDFNFGYATIDSPFYFLTTDPDPSKRVFAITAISDDHSKWEGNFNVEVYDSLSGQEKDCNRNIRHHSLSVLVCAWRIVLTNSSKMIAVNFWLARACCAHSLEQKNFAA